MTEPDLDEELAELGTYLPAEEPAAQEAVYGLIRASMRRKENLEMLGDALENDRFNRAQGLYMREDDFRAEFKDYFSEMDEVMLDDEPEAVITANKIGMALSNEYHEAMSYANIVEEEGGSSSMVETVLEKGSI